MNFGKSDFLFCPETCADRKLACDLCVAINLDDLLPRVDISKQITEALVTKMNNTSTPAAWQERKEGSLYNRKDALRPCFASHFSAHFSLSPCE